MHRSAFAATGRQTAPAARGRASRRNQRRCRRASDILAGRGGSLRRTLRVGDRGSDKPACVPSTSVSPLKRRERYGLVTSGRARRHDVTKGVWGFWGVEGGSVPRLSPIPGRAVTGAPIRICIYEFMNRRPLAVTGAPIRICIYEFMNRCPLAIFEARFGRYLWDGNIGCVPFEFRLMNFG